MTIDDLLGVLTLGEVHEGESAWTTGFAVCRQHHLLRFRDVREQGTQIGFSSTVGQVSDE